MHPKKQHSSVQLSKELCQAARTVEGGRPAKLCCETQHAVSAAGLHTSLPLQAVFMLSQHLDKARQEVRALREAPATRQGSALVPGRPPLPGLDPSAAVSGPAAALGAVATGSLWGGSASLGSSGVGVAPRQGWHLQQGQREELQRMERQLTAAAARQECAEQPTEGGTSSSGDQRSAGSHAHLPMPMHLLGTMPEMVARPAPGCIQRPIALRLS